jgi:hypothetical protein
MNLRDRHFAIKALEKVQIRELSKTLAKMVKTNACRHKHLLTCLVAVIVKCRQDDVDPHNVIREQGFVREILLRYAASKRDIKIVQRVLLTTLIMPGERDPPTPKKNRKIDELSDEDAYCFTRFTKPQLHQLLLHLRIPNRFKVVDGHVFMGEETLIICLTKMAHGEAWHSMKDKFGGNPDFWGYAFRAFNSHLYNIFYHKFTGNSFEREWLDKVDEFRKLIWNKMRISRCEVERFQNGDDEDAEINIIDIAFDVFRIFGFIDDTLIETARPGAGPKGNHEHAPRRDHAYYIQRAFFRYVKIV